jgi:hypothetical protein
LTGDSTSALAGFLAVGITVAGALAFGRRWWPPYMLLASSVALVLLIAPDAYTAFGLIFLSLVAAWAIAMCRLPGISPCPVGQTSCRPGPCRGEAQ